jgi:hypothetical protein
MKSKIDVLEKFRVKHGPLRSTADYGNNGAFLVRCPETKRKLLIIISDRKQWEHASVSIANKPNRIPSWDEMVFAKNLFWEMEECVIQYHPSASKYVNNHPGVLHLWKPTGQEIPMPPLAFV